MTQPFSRASLEYLPVYKPNPDEINDPNLYASNVRQIMAQALQIPTSDLTFDNLKQKKKLDWFSLFMFKKDFEK